MRRRLWCVKYALALLTSAAITFHLLYTPPGYDVETRWTHDIETPREPDIYGKTPNSLVFIKNSVFYDVESIRKSDADPVGVETFGKKDANHEVVTLRRHEVEPPRKPDYGKTPVFIKYDAETSSKRDSEVLVETQMKPNSDFRIETAKKNYVNHDVDMPRKLNTSNSIEAYGKQNNVFYAEKLRKSNVAAYNQKSKIQNVVLRKPDVDFRVETAMSPKKNIYIRRRLSHRNANVSTNGYIVLPGNVTIHVGNVRISLDVKFLNAASGVCNDFDVARTSLVVFVASSVEHFEKRQAVRDTWGLRMLQASNNFRVVFLLGKSLGHKMQEMVQQEIYRYGDIVQLDQEESFRNLGLKSVAGLKWSKDFCPNAEFVMKTDDDILVHVPNLLDVIGSLERTDDLLMCHENRKRKILRKELLDKTDLPNSYHKYQVSEDELPGTYYPPYCSGMAYVFSASVRDRLLDSCSKTPVFFVEDVHVTGFCRHKSGVRIRPHPGIALRPPIQTSCSFKGDDRRITSQELDVEGLRLLWTEMNTRGFFCPQLLGLRRNNAAHTKNSNVTRVV